MVSLNKINQNPFSNSFSKKDGNRKSETLSNTGIIKKCKSNLKNQKKNKVNKGNLQNIFEQKDFTRKKDHSNVLKKKGLLSFKHLLLNKKKI